MGWFLEGSRRQSSVQDFMHQLSGEGHGLKNFQWMSGPLKTGSWSCDVPDNPLEGPDVDAERQARALETSPEWQRLLCTMPSAHLV